MAVSLSIKDRRWAWKFGTPISGRYNLRNADGSIWSPSLATPQELASLLLDAMGEEEYDVSALPNDSRPEVHWDYANPATELNNLVTPLGCRIVLDNEDFVSIQVAGQGADLPITEDSRTIDYGIDPPDKPDALLFVAARTRYETAFTLQAVGEEIDGSIVPIANLSYAPANSWGSEAVVNGQFGNVTCPSKWLSLFNNNQTQANDYARSLARKTVYRWWQINGTSGSNADAAFIIPGCSLPVENLWQLLPIEDGRVTIYTDADSIQRPAQALLFGTWWDASADASTPTTNRTWLDGHSIDREHGIVKLNKPAVTLTAGNSPPFSAATLFLVCAHHVKDPETLVEDRYTFELPIGEEFGVGQQVVERSDVVRNVVGQYNASGPGQLTGYADNLPLVLQEVQYYLSAALAKFEIVQTGHVEYRGILDISPDGAIQQVQWRGGKGGCFTIASRNTEFSAEVMPFQERQKLAFDQWAQRHVMRTTKIPPPPNKGALS
jgi:hypothetical protein